MINVLKADMCVIIFENEIRKQVEIIHPPGWCRLNCTHLFIIMWFLNFNNHFKIYYVQLSRCIFVSQRLQDKATFLVATRKLSYVLPLILISYTIQLHHVFSQQEFSITDESESMFEYEYKGDNKWKLV